VFHFSFSTPSSEAQLEILNVLHSYMCSLSSDAVEVFLKNISSYVQQCRYCLLSAFFPTCTATSKLTLVHSITSVLCKYQLILGVVLILQVRIQPVRRAWGKPSHFTKGHCVNHNSFIILDAAVQIWMRERKPCSTRPNIFSGPTN